MISAVAVADKKLGIARNGAIPPEMNIKADKQIFKQITTSGNVNKVVMGRKTWNTLPFKLPGRINVVISKSINFENDKEYKKNQPDEIYTSPMEFVKSINNGIDYFIIGGESIYKWFLDHNMISTFYINILNADCECDQFIEPCMRNFKVINFEHLRGMISLQLKYVNHQEKEFNNIIKQVLGGYKSADRTGTGTVRTFGHRLEFSLDNFPLMTSRRHPLRMIFEELMWVLRGQTQTTILQEKGVNVWNANTTKEFIFKQNLDIDLKENDIGRSYGYNMRTYSEFEPYDQLENALNLLKNNPSSRRIIINLWNPANVKKSALPPCLCWYQFFVRKTNNGSTYLDCQAMNRSSDIVVAGGWNIATAALLTYILAQFCGYNPGTLIWITGDTHIYLNNINAAEMLVSREPAIFPKLFINKKLNSLEDILDIQISDIQLINYSPGPKIKFEMNA